MVCGGACDDLALQRRRNYRQNRLIESGHASDNINCHLRLSPIIYYLFILVARPQHALYDSQPHRISFSQPSADGASVILTPLPPFISKSLGRSSLPGSDVHDAASMAILFYLLISQFRSTVKTE